MYGFRNDIILKEDSPTAPLTTYAKANLKAEEGVLPLASPNFCVTVARQATVYGLSPRMRFDLAINGMVLGLFKHKKNPVMRDGTQWRPFVHVRDTSKALITILESDQSKVNGRIFNVGSNEQNYQILPLAEMVAKAVSLPFELEWYGSPDTRSYKVDFTKIHRELNFTEDNTPKDGAKEMYEALQQGKVSDTLKTKTVEWYKYLMNAHAVVSQVSLNGTML